MNYRKEMEVLKSTLCLSFRGGGAARKQATPWLEVLLSFKIAFTLAETLITLGIIGIVVAMTLPTLINKVQGYVLQTQFKKAYNMLSVALVKMKADYSIDNLHREFVIYDRANNWYYRSNEFSAMFYKTIGADRKIPLYKVKNYNLPK